MILIEFSAEKGPKMQKIPILQGSWAYRYSKPVWYVHVE